MSVYALFCWYFFYFFVLLSLLLTHFESLLINLEKILLVLLNRYSQIVDCLIYAMSCTRQNISIALGMISEYISNLGS